MTLAELGKRLGTIVLQSYAKSVEQLSSIAWEA
jgi:hypothetical protein